MLPGVAAGRWVLVVTSPGYVAEERAVDLARGESLRLRIVLRQSVLEMDPLVVTGTRKETYVSESPVKVDVVTARHLERAGARNLMESIRTVNGLYQQVDCGVCYTNNIRINGMEGPYTSVLIDGMPIMGALASVYGLNGIGTSIIERLEIIKGPSSTLYGSEAMGGVVNVITKDPRFAPSYTVDVARTGYGETSVDAAVSRRGGRLSALLSGSGVHMDRFIDENGDGFSDLTLTRRASLFGKLAWRSGAVRRLELAGKYYWEDRFGGVEAWTPADRGSDVVYGESVVTDRFELIGTYRPHFLDDVRLEFSLSRHEQDSHYGDQRYDAVQSIGVANLLWDTKIGRRHDLLLGAALRYQTYDDDTPATVEPDRRVIPGLFVQDEFAAGRGVTLLGGFRIDHHDEHGFIVSPRANVKWQPLEHTTLRLNAGTGFRVVNLFTEDHAALSGSRDVVIVSDLEPERSASVALNVNQIIEFGPNPMMIDVDAFYTRFGNRIIPDYDVDPRLIVYDNLRGHAVTRGVALSLNQNVDFDRFLYTLGVTFQDVYTVEDGVREAEFFAPDYTAVLGFTYNVRRPRISVDYTGSLTGPMRLPEHAPPFERPTRSPTYSLHDVRVSWDVAAGATLYGVARNLFDYRQESPLIDPANPFGEDFDTNYVYAPVHGRSFTIGFRYAATR